MHPSPAPTRDRAGWSPAVAAILDEAAVLSEHEILELARRHRHRHGPGPCPSAPLESCRSDDLARSERIVAIAVARADATADVRRLRAAVEEAVRRAADEELLRAERVTGAICAAAAATSAAAIAALLPERMSPENAALLSATWLSVLSARCGSADEQ
jgi:hypothetical protein